MNNINIRNNRIVKEKVEKKLNSLFRKKYVNICSRATVAIYACLLSLNSKGYIVVPSNICPSVINVIYQTGFEPIYVDINLNNFNVCQNSLKSILIEKKNILGVIIPHFYGIPSEIKKLTDIVRNQDKKILIIEDVAQSFGAKTDNLLLGSFGDISVFSFGYSKIIDIGTGGAYMTDNFELFSNINKIISNLPFRKNNFLHLKKHYRLRYMNILKNESIDDDLLKIGEDLKSLFIYNCNSLFVNELLFELDNFSKNKSSRLSNFNLYKNNLKNKRIFLPHTEKGFVPWRFCFLSKRSQEITKLLREKNFNVSNWYPPIHSYYNKVRIKTDLTCSIKLGKEIVNLWIDKNTSSSEIYKISELINKII